MELGVLHWVSESALARCGDLSITQIYVEVAGLVPQAWPQFKKLMPSESPRLTIGRLNGKMVESDDSTVQVEGGQLSAASITLQDFQTLMQSHGVVRLYLKRLAPNDNSKNQVYVDKGSLTDINVLPVESVRRDGTQLKASLRFYWMDDAGSLHFAPGAQLILYPQYPEVRFSGFLAGCPKPPQLMKSRDPGRLLFLGVTLDRRIIGHAASPESRLAREVDKLSGLEKVSVFEEIPLNDSLADLLRALRIVHDKGWIVGKRLRSDGTVIAPYVAQNAGGFTLEAELGIAQNAIALPDFQSDIEVKQFNVRDFATLTSTSAITLMTPEPTGGVYKSEGPVSFVKRFGNHKPNLGRWDFTGIHRVGQRCLNTGLTMGIRGYDESRPTKIDFVKSAVQLSSDTGVIAAEWDMEGLVRHWASKHSQAIYVPSMRDGESFRFGPQVFVARETDFLLFLRGLARGNVYYDPGINVKVSATSKETPHRRSQFRVQFRDLRTLYRRFDLHTL